MENDPWWRFDFGAKEGYEFIGAFEDAIDMEGIQNGDVKLILFVGWSDAKAVSSYIIYYKNETDKKVHEYRVFKDGTIRESVVS